VQTASKTSVFIADSQFLTRKALADLVAELQDFELAGQSGNIALIFSKFVSGANSLLLTDQKSFDQYLINKTITDSSFAYSRLLVVSDFSNANDVHALIELGIKGMVTKKCSEDEIISAIKSVAKGERFYCNSVLNLLVDSEKAAKARKAFNLLSYRELEVLKLIANGNTTERIAQTLHISIHTVNSHRKNILKKLNIKSPVHLVAYAVENGLVSIDYKVGE